MNKNVVVVVVSNTNENDKIESYESVAKILQNAAETITKHFKTKPNSVNFINENGLLNDGCVIIGGLQNNNNNNNNNEEDSYQNVGVVVEDDKETTCESLEPNDVTKILTNQDDTNKSCTDIEQNKVANLLEKVDNIKNVPYFFTANSKSNATAISSKDLTNDLCVASSSSLKSNQGVKSKIFNFNGKIETYKTFEQNYDTEILENKFEKLTISNNVTEKPQPNSTAINLKDIINNCVVAGASGAVVKQDDNNKLENVNKSKNIPYCFIAAKSTPNASTNIENGMNNNNNNNNVDKMKICQCIQKNNIAKMMENAAKSKNIRYSFTETSIAEPTINTNSISNNNETCKCFIQTQNSKIIKNADVGRKSLLRYKNVSIASNIVKNKSNLALLASHDNKNPLIKSKESTKPIKPFDSFLEFDYPERIISNNHSFDCKICFNTCEPYDGIILRQCGHSFCLDCIRNLIKSCELVNVECPHVNDKNIKCKGQIKEFEILSILPQQEIEIYQERQFKLNVQSINGFIQCCTINCKGFYINEKGENSFSCDICKIVNCIACKATHQGMSCLRYKESIDTNLKLSNAYLRDRKHNGLAMDCPSCGAIVERTEGCEGMTCIICKTDLCWATKGLRWGPGGKGDESGGCRCNVNGKRCHPTCSNCH